MVFEISLLTVLVMAVLGGMCTYLANQNIAVFNDGFRPSFPQYLDGTIDRKTMFATSFALSFGLVIGFGLPTSIAGKIIIIHTILLACDIIGVAFAEGGIQKWIATACGAVFGVLLMFGMQGIYDLFAIMPVNFLDYLSSVGGLITVTFCIFPALAVAYQSGMKNGIITFALTMLVKQVTTVYGTFVINGVTIALSGDGMALLISIAAMVFFAARKSKGEKGEDGEEGEAVAVFAVFEENIKRIRGNFIILGITGGIVALATTLMLVAEGPASLVLTAEGNYTDAALVALGRCLGFIPLVMTTAIISGVYSPAGTKALHVPAILFINMGIMGLVGSFFVGTLIMIIEVLLLGYIAKGLDKYPGMKELGDNTRTAMSKVLDLALLIGGAVAANAISSSLGYIWVFGLYFLNSVSKKPIPSMAIGPIAAISLGILVNILHLIGLFPV